MSRRGRGGAGSAGAGDGVRKYGLDKAPSSEKESKVDGDKLQKKTCTNTVKQHGGILGSAVFNMLNYSSTTRRNWRGGGVLSCIVAGQHERVSHTAVM